MAAETGKLKSVSVSGNGSCKVRTDGTARACITGWKNKHGSMASHHSSNQSQLQTNAKQEKGPDVDHNKGLRRSTTKGVTSIFSIRRMTLQKMKIDASNAMLQGKSTVKLENTYKLKPDKGTTFSVVKVREIAYNILEKELKDKSYNPLISSKLACDVALQIKEAVKKLNIPRHKIICNAVIGEMGIQGLKVTSRAMWDISTDNFACANYQNKSIFAIALVYGVYFD